MHCIAGRVGSFAAIVKKHTAHTVQGPVQPSIDTCRPLATPSLGNTPSLTRVRVGRFHPTRNVAKSASQLQSVAAELLVDCFFPVWGFQRRNYATHSLQEAQADYTLFGCITALFCAFCTFVHCPYNALRQTCKMHLFVRACAPQTSTCVDAVLRPILFVPIRLCLCRVVLSCFFSLVFNLFFALQSLALLQRLPPRDTVDT